MQSSNDRYFQIMKIEANESCLSSRGITNDHTAYTLNKKRRWEIPDLLKETVLKGTKNGRMTRMIVSNNISRRGYCKEFYASNGKTRQVKGKNKGYFNGESLIRESNRENSKLENFDPTCLQVEFVYSCPASCSLTHNSNFVDQYTHQGLYKSIRNHYHRTFDYYNSTPRKSKKHLPKTESYVTEFYATLEQEQDEYVTEQEIGDEHMYRKTYGESVSLDDILLYKELVQSLKDSKISKRKSISPKQMLGPKDRKVYISETTSNSQTEVLSSEKATKVDTGRRHTHTNGSVLLILPKSELKDDLLIGTYKANYVSCEGFPRRFFIDISARMMNRLRTCKQFKDVYVGKYDIHACVVFSCVPYIEINTATGDAFTVSLNWNSTIEGSKLLNIPDGFYGSIEDVLEKAVSCLDKVTLKSIPEKEKEPSRYYSSPTFDILNRRKNFVKELNFVTTNFFYSDIFHSKRKTFDHLDHENEQSHVCNICFETETQTTGFALISCRHWFCGACWELYFKSRLQTGCLNITCPEHKCSEKIDYSVLLTFLNITEVLQFKRRVFESQLRSDSVWCPNPRCGRMIKLANSREPEDVTCLCGYQFCRSCKKESHWPLICSNALLYWKKLNRRGDDNLKIDLALKTTVRGKPCPKCNLFIEKNSGCFSMNCVCGAHFCWGCLGLYPDHQYSAKCNPGKNGDLEGTTKLNAVQLLNYDITSGKGISVAYQLAVNHRNARHPTRINKLKASCRNIFQRCKAKARRKGPLFFAMFLANDGIENSYTGNLDVEKEMKNLLSNIISIYVEFHHILEYSHLFLEQLNNKKVGGCMPLSMTITCCANLANKIHDLLLISKDVSDMKPILTALLEIQKEMPAVLKKIVRHANISRQYLV